MPLARRFLPKTVSAGGATVAKGVQESASTSTTALPGPSMRPPSRRTLNIGSQVLNYATMERRDSLSSVYSQPLLPIDQNRVFEPLASTKSLVFSQPISFNAAGITTTTVLLDAPDNPTPENRDQAQTVPKPINLEHSTPDLRNQDATNQNEALEIVWQTNTTSPANDNTGNDGQDYNVNTSSTTEVVLDNADPKQPYLEALTDFFSSEVGQRCLINAFAAAQTNPSFPKPPAVKTGSYVTEDQMVTLEEKVWIGGKQQDLRLHVSDANTLKSATSAVDFAKKFIFIMYKGRQEVIPKLCQKLSNSGPIEEQELLDPTVKEWMIYLIKASFSPLKDVLRSDAPDSMKAALEETQKSFISTSITKGLFNLKQSLLQPITNESPTRKKKIKLANNEEHTAAGEATGGIILN